MLNTQFIKSMTDLRLDPAKITRLAQESDNPVYIFHRGKPVSVVLDVKQYEDLIDKLEDALDAVEMRPFEKKTPSKKGWINQVELKKKLS